MTETSKIKYSNEKLEDSHILKETCKETTSMLSNGGIQGILKDNSGCRPMDIQEINENTLGDSQFIRREMLKLCENNIVDGFQFTIMTYNCLAQSLIRREMFPTSGNALKWSKRSKVLLSEFIYYNPDVLCLQEIDYVQYQNYWKHKFVSLGYECQFHKGGGKTHGISIVWKRNLFTMRDKMLINYDNELCGDIPSRTITNNVGLLIALEFSDTIMNRFSNTNISGILVGTTHLFWHPFGTFDRTRQCYVVLNKMKEFMHRVNVLKNNNDGDLNHWKPFFCGDFNSQPFDAPYLSIISKPVKYMNKVKTVIECSESYSFAKLEYNNKDKIEEIREDNTINYTSNKTLESMETILSVKLENLHNSLNMRAISLYSVGYKYVDPHNAGIDNDRGEPEISNWAHTWRGLLDYILYIKTWDFTDCRDVDSLEILEVENGVKILELLKMPRSTDMSTYGQPHEGEYPSDHLSMMCKIELKM